MILTAFFVACMTLFVFKSNSVGEATNRLNTALVPVNNYNK